MRIGFAWLVLLIAPVAWAQHDPHPEASANAKAASGADGAQRDMSSMPAGKASALRWTTAPLLLPARVARGERSQAQLVLAGIETSMVEVYAADGPAERRRVRYPVQEGRARIESATPEIGNYHWVVAREEHANEVRVATTAWYFGNPGASPTELLRIPKHELEIVPEPLPREHASYRESEKWRFLVRFQGKPLAGKAIQLETEFGTRIAFLTDRQGYATVLMPRDFKPRQKEEGRDGHGLRRAQFVLSVEHEGEGRRYFTAFNHVYGEDPERGRNLAWGVGFLLTGMAAGLPLLRRRQSARRGGDDA